MTKSESALKTGKAGSNRSSTPISKDYKPSRGNQRLIESTQQIAKKGYIGLTAADKKAINPKGNKSKGVTPKKKAEAPKPTKPKRKLFVGRGGGMRGGVGGGSDMFGQIK